MLAVTEKFRRCDAVTAAWEGGYVNHRKDPGGPTDRGVTQAKYNEWRDGQGLPRKSVKGISSAEAEQLFFSEFWIKCGGERLAAGVDLATYDAGVNSGVSRARKWLIASIGGPDHETVKKLCGKRLGFMQSLNIWKTFGKGWGRRVADIQAKGVAWALAAGNENHVVREQLRDESAVKTKVAQKQNAGAAAGQTTGAGAVVADQTTNVADWLLLGVGVGLFAMGAFLLVRMVLSRQQAAAFAREAEKV